MKLDLTKVSAIADQLAAVAVMVNPGAGASVALVKELLVAGAQLNSLIAGIKANDPDLWAKVSAGFDQALADFDASIPPAPPAAP